MTLISGRVRSQAWRRAVVSPSIREVCLVGVDTGCPAPAPNATSVLKGVWTSGESVTWSGRTYRVEATRHRTPGGNEQFRYVHLSVLTEG
jgi:hypothetical protein